MAIFIHSLSNALTESYHETMKMKNQYFAITHCWLHYSKCACVTVLQWLLKLCNEVIEANLIWAKFWNSFGSTHNSEVPRLNPLLRISKEHRIFKIINCRNNKWQGNFCTTVSLKVCVCGCFCVDVWICPVLLQRIRSCLRRTYKLWSEDISQFFISFKMDQSRW